MTEKTTHRGVELVLKKILAGVEAALQEGETQASLAEKCGITHQQMNRLIRGLRGSNLTLNMAFKIWEGLGHKLEYLFPGPIPEQLLIKTGDIIRGSDAELLNQFIDILHNRHSFCNDFDNLKSVVAATHRQLMAQKNQEP
ncbi:MAG: helix-turn-helix transcriptional regulator [Desulfobacca sp.]|nr:helix-turn-helix transcriptional regulator [Desulfobacca sp.]